MAKKGQKFKTCDNDIKIVIIKEKHKGKSYRYLSDKYAVSVGTIMTWMHKINRPELYPGHGQKRGRPKGKDLSKEDYKERYEILKKYQVFLKAQRERK